MRKISILAILFILLMLLTACGNLLEEPGIEPTLEQKMRGIWLVGGLSAGEKSSTASAVSQVDLYDPETDTWYANITSLPAPVSFAGITSCNGKIYVIGGFDRSGIILGTTQIYSVATNTWSAGSSIVGGAFRANITAVAIYDNIYFIGGNTQNASVAWSLSAANQVYEYNTLSDTWSLKIPTIASNRANSSLLGFNDIIYFLGGRTAVTTFANTHDGYVVSANAVSGGTEVVLPAVRGSCAEVIYSPSSGPAMLIIIGGFQALTAVTGNYIFYGSNPLTVVATAVNTAYYLNYPFTLPSAWTSFTSSYPISVGGAAAVMYGSTLYCFGGASSFIAGSNPSVYNDVYSINLSNLPLGSWVNKTSMPIARFGHTALKIRQ